MATFYAFFSLVPRGRHTTRCCLGTACYVRGGRENMEKLTRLLKVPSGQTTPDRRFFLETVRCLGACGLGLVIVKEILDHLQGTIQINSAEGEGTHAAVPLPALGPKDSRDTADSA